MPSPILPVTKQPQKRKTQSEPLSPGLEVIFDVIGEKLLVVSLFVSLDKQTVY